MKEKALKILKDYWLMAAIAILFFFTPVGTWVSEWVNKGKMHLLSPSLVENADLNAQPTLEAWSLQATTAGLSPVTFSSSDNRVYFINFWASWCPPCRAEMPQLLALHDSLKNNPNVKVLLVSLDEKPQKAIDYFEKQGFPAEALLLVSGRLPQVLATTSLPTTYVISADNKLALKSVGAADYADTDFINELKTLAATVQNSAASM